MDIDVAGWILEFLLRQNSVKDHTLDDLIRVLPIPDSNPSLKKSVLIRKIESSISKDPVSETVLELLECVEELDRKDGVTEVSEAMKAAYCAVAVHCVIRSLDGNDNAMEIVWKDRAFNMKKFFETPMAESRMSLISEELESWMRGIKFGKWDPPSVCENASMKKYVKRRDLPSVCENASMRKYVKGRDVVEVVRVYLAEAKETMGPPFLELVAEEAERNDVLREVMGVETLSHNVEEVGGGRKQGGGGEISLIRKLLKRRPKRAWSIEEENTLWIGVKKFGKGNWKLILNMYPDIFVGRNTVDLKDKWRNMCIKDVV